MDAYSNIPRNPYGFLGSRPATNPVINSDGRTWPVSSYFTDGNVESYLMTVETTVQRVPPSDMPAGSYEVARNRPQIVDQFQKRIQTEVSQPAWPPANEFQKRIQTEVSQPAWPPANEFEKRIQTEVSQPAWPPANEFQKRIQTEVSQPAWPPAMHQSPYEFPRSAPVVQFGPTTRVDFGDFNNGMPRSVTESGFVVQSRLTPPTIRTTPAPPRPNAKISQAMNDITEATEYLKELARPSIPNNHTITVPQNMVPSPAAINKGSAPVTIDSREAARRYKNAIVSMEPYGKESSTPMLDSKTAKDKYRGVFV